MKLFTRFGLVLAVALATALGLAGPASAQMALGDPYGPADTGRHTQQIRPGGPGSQIQRPVEPASPSAPAAQPGGIGTMAYGDCGFYSGSQAWYRHCKPNWIVVRVSFWYGWSHRDIWVRPYSTTNLSTHPQLQGAGMITSAWCVAYC